MTQTPAVSQMADLAHSLFDAYNRHDVDALARLYLEESSHTEMSHGGRKSGRKAIAAGLATLLHSFPDATWQVHEVMATQDAVAVTYSLVGSLQADLGPYQAAGQHLHLPGVLVLHRAGDRISCSEDYWDSATFSRQMRVDAT